MTEEQWFIDAYDEVVQSEPDGVELAKIKHEVGLRYEDAVESGEIERDAPALSAEGEDKFDKYIPPARRSRKAVFRRDLGNLLDALNGETVLGEDDPRLDQAFPIGDGRDKTLRYWSVDDFQNALSVRYAKAADSMDAADGFAKIAREVIRQMSAHNARMFGRLFAEPEVTP